MAPALTKSSRRSTGKPFPTWSRRTTSPTCGLCAWPSTSTSTACTSARVTSSSANWKRRCSTPNAPHRHLVQSYLDHARGRKTIVFTPTVALAHEMVTAFTAAGIASDAVEAATPVEERRAMLQRFRHGTTQVLANCGVLTEGYDEPSASRISDRPADALACALHPDDRAGPEAFVEQLALRSGDSATWWVDEFGETLDHLHHAKYMTGLRGLLLELYEGADHRSRRTTKRTKSGTPIPDEMIVTRPHLSLLGCGTPAIFEILSSRDLSSGFLAPVQHRHADRQAGSPAAVRHGRRR